jgi:hypothetical protein
MVLELFEPFVERMRCSAFLGMLSHIAFVFVETICIVFVGFKESVDRVLVDYLELRTWRWHWYFEQDRIKTNSLVVYQEYQC